MRRLFCLMSLLVSLSALSWVGAVESDPVYQIGDLPVFSICHSAAVLDAATADITAIGDRLSAYTGSSTPIGTAGPGNSAPSCISARSPHGSIPISSTVNIPLANVRPHVVEQIIKAERSKDNTRRFCIVLPSPLIQSRIVA